MEESDRITEINTAIEKSIEKDHIQIAKKAFQEGASVEFVNKITGLSVQDLQDLLQ
jgi:hypothetical protein